MKLIEVAKSFIRLADARLEDAKGALKDRIYPYALRLSQESTELALKASLKAVGIEYPKKHDVSRVLLQARGRFPKWFEDNVAFMAEASRKLERKREVSMYGNEASILSPEKVISKEEAVEAVEIADKINRWCKKLVKEASKL